MRLLKKSLNKKIGLVVATLLLALTLMPGSSNATSSFKDVTSFKEEVDFLSGLGIIKGFPDGSFKPAAAITRLDAVRMILRELDDKDTVGRDPGFADVTPDTPGYDEVAKAVKLGFIEGKETTEGVKYFDPKGQLTRAEMAKILTLAYQLKEDKKISFIDVHSSYWANAYISRLATAGVTNGYPGGTFKPNESLQRQHFAAFMARLLAPEKFPVAPKTPEKQVTYVTIDQLNMRSKPSVSGLIIGSIPKGGKVEYMSKEGTWYKVKYGSKAGWVNSAYLSNSSSLKTAYPAPSNKTPGTYAAGILIVNKQYGLPSNYNPGVNKLAQKAIDAMVLEAKKQEVGLTAFSTFRSYNRQKELYNNYVRKNGVAEANRFSAKPGYSEHQTGLAFDLGGSNQSQWLKESFAATKEGKWLAANAHQYGFILRYPKGKEKITGYMYEPWHYRYIGSELAPKVKNSGKTLEEYVNVAGK
ncbi:peptidase M15 [Planococcus sp. PAMC 21323]|uniref:D-alanyl-D-alanine carboxypeptidase family protein n=1 Tax=Planococcus sp. PAMC 21323 TaxID=1526927 RepID=UPI00056DFC73|nr:D-alanyl-D-alanine carboxypeptidase family protein [Planococcus sp. PAMC 21323]AIY07036.1 peptidase M15 [Planococcus sp. PAMC 21323]